MKETKTKILIVSVLLIIPTIILTILLFNFNNNKNEEQGSNFISDDYIISKVYDINEFYNVNYCITNYLNHVNNLNNEEILKLLDNNYLKNNNIDKNNLNNYIDTFNGLYNYSLKNIDVYSNSYYKIYLTKGLYTKEDDEIIYNSKYISHIVILDIINNTYSIIPLIKENESFEKVLENYDLKNYNLEIETNVSNEIISQNISEFEEALLYFSNFKNELINDCSEAYKYIDNDIKKEKFVIMCSNYLKNYGDSIITKYKKNVTDDGVKLIINDQYGNIFGFKYLEVDNYTVSITFKD